MSIALGTTLNGRYRLEERIGSGGMSTVYRAIDEILQRQVAVKVMNQEVAEDSDQLERFRREARAVAQLSHAHVVGVIDAGEDDGRPYIVFEFVDGETLKERIRRLGRLPIPEAVSHTIELARALEAAHARHIVHRDVKPQNVLIDADGVAKVTDFGIARTLEEDGLTADGRVIGTTDYVSPEQALGQHVTGRSDLYSLGIVLYEMLAGEVPYKGDNQVAVAMKHVNEPMPDVRVRRPEISEQLATVVDTATAKNAADRYPNEHAMIADLEAALVLETRRTDQPTAELDAIDSPDAKVNARKLGKGGKPPVARSPAEPDDSGRSASTWLVPLAIVAVVLIAGAIVALSLSGGGKQPGHANTTPTDRPASVVSLCSSCATAYNPDGYGGQTDQNNYEAPNAIDGKPSTAWYTETYYDGQLNKAGVGLYVKASEPTTATELAITTTTPGFSAEIYGSSRQPSASDFAGSGWQKLATVADVKSGSSIPLSTSSGKHTYFLVWITQLPPGQNSAALNELKLYGY